MKEEVHDDKNEDEASDLEHGRVFDAVLGLEFSDVSHTASRKFVSIEPLQHHETGDDAHQNPRAHFDDEIVERDAVFRHVSVLSSFRSGYFVRRKP